MIFEYISFKHELKGWTTKSHELLQKWRSKAKSIVLNREVLCVQQALQQTKRESQATIYFQSNLILTYFTAWQTYIEMKNKQKKSKEQREETKQKTKCFLQTEKKKKKVIVQKKVWKPPEFLQKMEFRDQERQLKRKERLERIKERDLKKEQEKQQLIIKELMEKRQKEQEQKQMEQQKKQKEEQEKQLLISNLKKSKQFFQKLLLKRGFKALVHFRINNFEKTQQIIRKNLKKAHFLHWKSKFNENNNNLLSSSLQFKKKHVFLNFTKKHSEIITILDKKLKKCTHKIIKQILKEWITSSKTEKVQLTTTKTKFLNQIRKKHKDLIEQHKKEKRKQLIRDKITLITQDLNFKEILNTSHIDFMKGMSFSSP